jgi:hypothetical protein
MIDSLTSNSHKFESSHLHTQRNCGKFISNRDSTGIHRFEIRKKNGPVERIWTDP